MARANYLAQDRSDIQFSVKELARSMSSPTRGSWKGLLKLGKYLKNHYRSGYCYPYQDNPNELTVWTDTDYAGCTRTRKSTSGGVVMLGSHMIKSWSSTQSVVALSSGEAEYYGMVKGASVAIGLQSVLKDFQVTCGIEIKSDASAAIGIANRRGLGKVRQCQLWLQNKVRNGDIRITKVCTYENLAGALTKFVGKDEIEVHMKGTNQVITNGRHELAPAVEC